MRPIMRRKIKISRGNTDYRIEVWHAWLSVQHVCSYYAHTAVKYLSGMYLLDKSCLLVPTSHCRKRPTCIFVVLNH